MHLDSTHNGHVRLLSNYVAFERESHQEAQIVVCEVYSNWTGIAVQAHLPRLPCRNRRRRCRPIIRCLVHVSLIHQGVDRSDQVKDDDDHHTLERQ